MKKLFLLCAGLMGFATFSAQADITINLPASGSVDSVTYICAQISGGDSQIKKTVPVSDNKAIIPVGDDKGGYTYTVVLTPRNYFFLYAVPGDNLVADVVSVNPVDVNISGTVLADQENELDAILKPYMNQLNELSKATPRDNEKIMAVAREYNGALNKFVTDNPDSPKVCFALLQMRGEDFVKAFNGLTDDQKASPIYPLLEKKMTQAQIAMEKERKLQEMQSGDFDAPAFTLVDLDGKNVSLSDFRGKWVILDFWGSWCGWCIKGFPELKEIYAKYPDKLVIVGIDNRDSVEDWKAAVAKHQLPWVNLYNPQESTLTKEYGVSGFPTKIIVNPEGKIANITVGHTPDYTKTVEDTISK